MMHRILLCISLVILIKTGLSQELPTYTQLFFNPYAYNPSFAGGDDAFQINLAHRRQSAGTEGAPTASSLYVQLPDMNNFSLGLTVNHERAAIQNSVSTYASLAYKLNFEEEGYCKFGLSLGLGSRRLDLVRLSEFGDPNVLADPELAEFNEDRLFANAQAGFHVYYKKFKLSAAFPRLLESRNLALEDDRVRFAQFQEKIFMASYRVDLGATKNFEVEPFLIYRTGDDLREQIEGALTFYYRQKFWVGGSVRKNTSLNAYLGLSVTDYMNLSYAFESPSFELNGLVTPSHELQIAFRFGGRKVEEKQKRPKRLLYSNDESATPKEQQPLKTLNRQTAPDISEQVDSKQITPIPVKLEDEDKSGQPVETTIREEESKDIIEKGNYVIVGSFDQLKNALEYGAEAEKRGFSNTVGQVPGYERFYVYVAQTETWDEALKIRAEMLELKFLDFPKTWILTIE